MCTRRQSICYPYSRHPLQAQAPLNLSVMACHSLERTQVLANVEFSWILFCVRGHVFLNFAFLLLVMCVDQARTLRCLMPTSQQCGWRFRPAGFVWLYTVGPLLLRWFWEIASSTDATAHHMLQMMAEDEVRCVSYLCTFYFARAVVAVVCSH